MSGSTPFHQLHDTLKELLSELRVECAGGTVSSMPASARLRAFRWRWADPDISAGYHTLVTKVVRVEWCRPQLALAYLSVILRRLLPRPDQQSRQTILPLLQTFLGQPRVSGRILLLGGAHGFDGHPNQVRIEEAAEEVLEDTLARLQAASPADGSISQLGLVHWADATASGRDELSEDIVSYIATSLRLASHGETRDRLVTRSLKPTAPFGMTCQTVNARVAKVARRLESTNVPHAKRFKSVPKSRISFSAAAPSISKPPAPPTLEMMSTIELQTILIGLIRRSPLPTDDNYRRPPLVEDADWDTLLVQGLVPNKNYAFYALGKHAFEAALFNLTFKATFRLEALHNIYRALRSEEVTRALLVREGIFTETSGTPSRLAQLAVWMYLGAVIGGQGTVCERFKKIVPWVEGMLSDVLDEVRRTYRQC
ncbi:hypothetical protein MKEN_00305800 [Mycena kentingensis (nom. inval.)]|nr:hypothetical protein MKEN_00305800 [Mycena kentingensis (nom. inval.)]